MLITRRLVLAATPAAMATRAFAQTHSPPPMTILIHEAGPAWKVGRPLAEQGMGPHLGYVAQQFAAGRVVAYGTEAGSVVRGYYVLAGAEPAVATDFTGADPGLRSGVIVNRSVHTWEVLINRFQPRQDGQAYAILRMQPGPRWVAGKPLTEQDVQAHFGYMTGQAKAGIVLAAGPDGSGQEGWYVLRGNAAVVKKLLASDPGIRSGVLKPVVVGWNVIGMQAAPN